MRRLLLGVLLLFGLCSASGAADMAEILLLNVSASRIYQYAPQKTYIREDEGGAFNTEVNKYRTTLGVGLRYYDRHSIGMHVNFRFIKLELDNYGWKRISEDVANSSVFLVISPVPEVLENNSVLVYPTVGLGIGTLQSTFDSCIKPVIMAEIGVSWKQVALSIGTEHHVGKMNVVYPGRQLDSYFTQNSNIEMWDPIEIEMTVLYYLNVSFVMPMKL